MSINLYKNHDQLIESYREVTDDKKPTQWAVYGYASDSYDLELVSTGSGLDELADELDSSKIQYVFLRVIDPNTELTKYVLINWQGEGAALSRKGLCANHIKDVNGFFRGAHVTINARTEDEVEPSVIMAKVSKASATKLNLKDRSDPSSENIGPVGTTYSRIQPAREINSSERENFWTKQQEDERRRKIDERKRAENERKKLEENEKLRELQEAKEREQLSMQRERELCKRREEEKNAENRARDLLEERRLSVNDDEEEDPEEERMRRAEAMRQSRADEARSLISGSTIRSARAMFEQNSSEAQNSKPPVPAPKSKSLTVSQGSYVASARQQFMQSPPAGVLKSSGDKPLSDIVNRNAASDAVQAKESPKSASASNGSLNREKDVRAESPAKVEDEEVAAAGATTEPQAVEEDDLGDSELGLREEDLRRAAYNDVPIIDHVLEDIQEESEDVDDDGAAADRQTSAAAKSEHGIRAKALYDYQAADETEISFDPDDIITHVDMIDPGWYQGMSPDGSYGLFPANYVEIIDIS